MKPSRPLLLKLALSTAIGGGCAHRRQSSVSDPRGSIVSVRAPFVNVQVRGRDDRLARRDHDRHDRDDRRDEIEDDD